jgi:predicted enzyme related to lactoylglutathione lyase
MTASQRSSLQDHPHRRPDGTSHRHRGSVLRARDPDALARWYADHLGIDPVPASYAQWPWWQQQGPTVLSPFPAASDAFGSPEQAWMLNLRVRDLDAMVAQLRAAGVEVTPDPRAYPNGRFAITADPEGNPIQLWEPTQDTLQEPPDRHR